MIFASTILIRHQQKLQQKWKQQTNINKTDNLVQQQLNKMKQRNDAEPMEQIYMALHTGHCQDNQTNLQIMQRYIMLIRMPWS